MQTQVGLRVGSDTRYAMNDSGLERGPSLVFRSEGFADAAEGFLDLVTARLWNGTFEKVLLISDQARPSSVNN